MLTVRQPLALPVLSLGPALSAIEGLLLAEALSCLDDRRTPDGLPWAPLQGPSRSVGATRRALAARATDGYLEQSCDVAHAGYQQQGTRRMPARPFLGITDAMVSRAEDIAGDYVLGALGGLAGR